MATGGVKPRAKGSASDLEVAIGTLADTARVAVSMDCRLAAEDRRFPVLPPPFPVPPPSPLPVSEDRRRPSTLQLDEEVD